MSATPTTGCATYSVRNAFETAYGAGAALTRDEAIAELRKRFSSS